MKYNKEKKNKMKSREEGGKEAVCVRVRSRSPVIVRASLEGEDVENNRERKKDRNDNQAAEETDVEVRELPLEEGIRVRSLSPARISVVEEEVIRFHHKVGHAVMTVMNQYWPGSGGFTGVRKIRNEEEYCNTANNLSKGIREKIKEGYKAFNRNTLEGISFTGDHALFIQTEVESFFEERPQIS